MALPRWDPEHPIPPDEGGFHSHAAGGIRIDAAMSAPGNDIPEGEWRVLLTLSAVRVVEAGHRLAYVMTPELARTIAAALIQAAGDVDSGRIDSAYPEDR